MASFELYGFDDLEDAIRRIANIPERVITSSLDEMAEIAVEKIRAEGESMGVRDPESDSHILDRISPSGKAKKTDYGGYKMITFKGKRRRGKTDTRNAEIAFVNEYGKEGQPARPFIRTALNRNEGTITAPAEKIIGDWIETEYMKN